MPRYVVRMFERDTQPIGSYPVEATVRLVAPDLAVASREAGRRWADRWVIYDLAQDLAAPEERATVVLRAPVRALRLAARLLDDYMYQGVPLLDTGIAVDKLDLLRYRAVLVAQFADAGIEPMPDDQPPH